MPRGRYVIAQLSDLHCGDPRFDAEMMARVVEDINDLRPDAVAVPGDLTVKGYADEFEKAAAWLARIQCPNIVVVPGNHDERNVGWEIFDQFFGDRFQSHRWPFGLQFQGREQTEVIVAALDSCKPDLDDGEVGRVRYDWIRSVFDDAPDAYRIVVIHHHLVSIPGTGRERNILWDAGDVLDVLGECEVDLVLAGHKHVPYVWELNGMLLSTSGTASTHRTRGLTPPSWTAITIESDHVTFEMIPSVGGTRVKEMYPRHAKPEMR